MMTLGLRTAADEPFEPMRGARLHRWRTSRARALELGALLLLQAGFQACGSQPAAQPAAVPMTTLQTGAVVGTTAGAMMMAGGAGRAGEGGMLGVTPGAGRGASAGAAAMLPVLGGAGASASSGGGAAPGHADYSMDGPLDGTCPTGFTPKSGRNTGFKTATSGDRDFIVYLPNSGMDSPRPVYVAITGTVQEEEQFANRDSQLAPVLTGMGWIVIAPVRHCSMSGQSCYSEGSDGWIWYPWNDGSLDPKWAQAIGPDGEFVEAMVRCAGTQWKMDRRRIFVGGISAGGSFTYRNLSYNSKFFAGGVPGSGMWYTDTDTGPLKPAGNQKLLMENPTGIFDGGCCPRPIKDNKLEPMIIIDLWGGPSDTWTNPMNNPNRELTFDYRAETQAASNYFATQKDNGVVYLACSGPQGHGWPGSALGGGANARDFDTWMAGVLMAHPKGTPVADFKLPTSFPEGYSCVQGRYTDHYGK